MANKPVQEFEVAKKRKVKIEFSIGGDGHVYSFDPPKSATMMMPVLDAKSDDTDAMEIIAVRSTFHWFLSGLGEEDAAILRGRIDDPADDLDMEDLTTIMTALQGQITGRPTG